MSSTVNSTKVQQRYALYNKHNAPKLKEFVKSYIVPNELENNEPIIDYYAERIYCSMINVIDPKLNPKYDPDYSLKCYPRFISFSNYVNDIEDLNGTEYWKNYKNKINKLIEVILADKILSEKDIKYIKEYIKLE